MNEASGQRGRRDRGHRGVPHTADLRIEAWGPTREECIAEAVRGLVDSVADVSVSGVSGAPGEGGAVGGQRVTERHLSGGSDADLLAAAIEEVIYGLDADGEIPVSVTVRHAADGGIDLILRVVGTASVEIIGAAPKGASLSGLACAPLASGGWSCAVTVDV